METKHTVETEDKAAFKEEKALSTDLHAKKDSFGVVASDVAKKHWGKKSFFQFMKPIVENENRRVMQERGRLLAWQKNNDFEVAALKSIAQRYRV
ncbi:MAG: hypothetical protein COB41_05260 [Proteobacteria bacterium]|nr:MAG: hypothetical protein COB41_05260 [Pseudomonadota bacterium]